MKCCSAFDKSDMIKNVGSELEASGSRLFMIFLVDQDSVKLRRAATGDIYLLVISAFLLPRWIADSWQDRRSQRLEGDKSIPPRQL